MFDNLIQGFFSGQQNTVTVEFNPEDVRGGIVVLLSRLAGLVDALGPRNIDGIDPLSNVDAGELLYLLDHLHRVRMCLQGQEERVMGLANDNGASLRSIATAMEVGSPATIRSLLIRIREAGQRGITAAALDLDTPPAPARRKRTASLFLVRRASLRDGAGEMLAAFEASHDAIRYANAYNAEFELEATDPTRAQVLTVAPSYPNEIDDFPEIQPATRWTPQNGPRAVVENPHPGWFVAAIRTTGAYIPVAACGSADRAEVTRRGLALLIEQEGEAFVWDLLGSRVAVPGDPTVSQ